MNQDVFAPVPPATPRHGPRCINCGADAPGKYCPECGQETRVALPTVREIMRDAAGRLVAIDSRLWRTLGLLLFRPGMLTTEYLRGRRKSYVRPARLFFVMALLLFAVIRLVGTPVSITEPSAVDAPATRSDDRPAGENPPTAAANLRSPRGVVHIDDDDERVLRVASERLPMELRRRIERFKHLSPEDKAEQLYSGVLRFAPYAMVVLLPIFALLTKLSYVSRRRRHSHYPSRYVEHLVYGAHLHAFVFLMIMAMTLVPSGLASAALALWIVVYVGRARRNVFGGSWLDGFLRGLAVAGVYMALLAMTMVGLVLVAVAMR